MIHIRKVIHRLETNKHQTGSGGVPGPSTQKTKVDTMNKTERSNHVSNINRLMRQELKKFPGTLVLKQTATNKVQVAAQVLQKRYIFNTDIEAYFSDYICTDLQLFLKLFKDLRKKHQSSMLFITHDFGIVFLGGFDKCAGRLVLTDIDDVISISREH